MINGVIGFMLGAGTAFLIMSVALLAAESRAHTREMRRYNALATLMAKTSKPVNKP
ncbi:hypothetical protein UFOVP199_13 [uncultured Caudovirales phage]|uniref:Uncharacterized protein n=1 Tax=uncultured Caudovirales phage TaxID=2100421 RepID=A0A6J7WII4_9CAUD|nr:hypothetical protein UFOVP199_13 [uncultured Caudovirales phage]